MYNLSEKQRNIIAGIVLVLILSALSWWNREDKENKVNQAASNEQNILITDDGIVTDLRASEQVLGEVVKLEDVERDINESLGTDRKIEIPEIADSALNITKVNTAQGITLYSKNIVFILEEYSIKTDEIVDRLYDDSITNSELDQIIKESEDAIEKLYAISVPRDAVDVHKSALIIFESTENLIKEAKNYKNNPTDEIWQTVYYQYALSNEAYKKLDSDFEVLKQKYGLSI